VRARGAAATAAHFNEWPRLFSNSAACLKKKDRRNLPRGGAHGSCGAAGSRPPLATPFSASAPLDSRRRTKMRRFHATKSFPRSSILLVFLLQQYNNKRTEKKLWRNDVEAKDSGN